MSTTDQIAAVDHVILEGYLKKLPNVQLIFL